MRGADIPREQLEAGWDADEERLAKEYGGRHESPHDPRRETYLKKRCTCGSGLARWALC